MAVHMIKKIFKALLVLIICLFLMPTCQHSSDSQLQNNAEAGLR
jgi:uncharacterized lipoprotein YajG